MPICLYTHIGILHRNIMHHIGALFKRLIAPQHNAPHWCIVLHRNIMHHIGALFKQGIGYFTM